MKPSDQMADFVRDALRAGRTRDDIARALTSAGWSDADAQTALNGWADDPIGPVPRPAGSSQSSLWAAEAFFYALLFIALGVSSVHVIQLGFEMVDLWMPDDTTNGFGHYSARVVRRSIAALVVFLPLFFWLNHRSMRATRADPSKRLSPVRRWLTYAALLCSAVTLLGNLIWLIFRLLEGDLTLQVLAKTGILDAVALAILFYFRAEAREAVKAA